MSAFGIRAPGRRVKRDSAMTRVRVPQLGRRRENSLREVLPRACILPQTKGKTADHGKLGSSTLQQ